MLLILNNNFINIESFSSTIKLDIRYATENNFLKKKIYKIAKAFLVKEVAEDLITVNNRLNEKGLGILLFDAYRPWSVTKMFWDETEEKDHKFLANPKTGSNHNRGCAVDISLYDLKTQKELLMPCEFDTFSEEAYTAFMNCSKEAIDNRHLLISEMEKDKKFKVHPYEYWHFDHISLNKYSVLDIDLVDIEIHS